MALAAIMAVSGCKKAGPAPGSRRGEGPKSVKTEAVRQDKVARNIDVVGTLAAQDQVTIASQADGAVSRVLADLGDKVSSGQALIELDREKLQYNLDNQKAALARALAKYGAPDAAHLPPVDQTPDVQKASAELAQAKQAYDRAQTLARRQLLATQSMDDAETTLRSKQAAYDSALQNARNLQADIDASTALLKLADRQLRDATIRAPFDGYVQKRLVSVGDFVKTQAPVMNIVRMDTLRATGEIPEKMAPWVKVGEPVSLTVDAFPNRQITGTIARISPAVNPSTRAFPFEASVPNADGSLKPGTFARVHFATALVEPVLTIPYAAMQYRYGVYRAFVVKGDALAMHELKTGDRNGDRMEILAGLELGDQVALTDVDNLADGMKLGGGGGRGGGGRGDAGRKDGKEPAPAAAAPAGGADAAATKKGE